VMVYLRRSAVLWGMLTGVTGVIVSIINYRRMSKSSSGRHRKVGEGHSKARVRSLPKLA
jgi:hypothetical protein